MKTDDPYEPSALPAAAPEAEAALEDAPPDTELLTILPRVVAGPARLQRALTIDEVAGHRHVHCPRYGECLEEAMRWPGFSCRGCPLFSETATAVTRREALDRIVAGRQGQVF